jgi:methyl-accepting chemotaxis protein
MDETLQRINEILKKFNSTFEISANQIAENDEQVVSGFKIDGLKNDGSEFVDELYDMFSDIVKAISEEHELVYNKEKGLVIAKKVTRVDYIIEE